MVIRVMGLCSGVIDCLMGSELVFWGVERGVGDMHTYTSEVMDPISCTVHLMCPSFCAWISAMSPSLSISADFLNGELAGVKQIKIEKTYRQHTCSSLLKAALQPYHLLPWLRILDIQVGI
jgi:hypothetical protein